MSDQNLILAALLALFFGFVGGLKFSDGYIKGQCNVHGAFATSNDKYECRKVPHD